MRRLCSLATTASKLSTFCIDTNLLLNNGAKLIVLVGATTLFQQLFALTQLLFDSITGQITRILSDKGGGCDSTTEHLFSQSLF
jgi:hypothetical protein